MKKLPVGFASPLILLAVGLIVGIGITFAYFQFKSKPSHQNQPSLIPQSTPASTPNPDASREPNGSAETANWKTYTDNGFKFEIKYPNNLKTNKLTAHDDLLGGVSLYLIYNDQEFRPQMSEISVWVEDSKGLSLEEWLKEKSTAEPWGSPVNKKEFYGYKNLGTEVLDGVQGIKFLNEPMGYTSVKVAAKKGDFIYLVGYVNIKEDLSLVYNQILSTFQFIN